MDRKTAHEAIRNFEDAVAMLRRCIAGSGDTDIYVTTAIGFAEAGLARCGREVVDDVPRATSTASTPVAPASVTSSDKNDVASP